MADNYSECTGVLVLTSVTTVIKSLFRHFNLDEAYPGNGTVYFADRSEDSPMWARVVEDLQALAKSLGLEIDEGADDQSRHVLETLGAHFGVSANPAFKALLDGEDFDDCPSPGTLFRLALHFNDGHGLSAIASEGCWRCSKPRLWEFGGVGIFQSTKVDYFEASSTAAQEIGPSLHAALMEQRHNDAAEVVLKKTQVVLDSIVDETDRRLVKERLKALLVLS